MKKKLCRCFKIVWVSTLKRFDNGSLINRLYEVVIVAVSKM